MHTIFKSVTFITVVLCVCSSDTLAAERIIIEAKVNDWPVRLAFDTGAERSVLFPRLCLAVDVSGLSGRALIPNADSVVSASGLNSCPNWSMTPFISWKCLK